jgi:hypothetical protein
MGGRGSTRWARHDRRPTERSAYPLPVVAFADSLHDARLRWVAADPRPSVLWLRATRGLPRAYGAAWRFAPDREYLIDRRPGDGVSAPRPVVLAGELLCVPLRRDPATGRRVPSGPPRARARVEATAAAYGGVRWWWRCAWCGHRRSTLYAPTPAEDRATGTTLASVAAAASAMVASRRTTHRLAGARCRRCLGLAYESQRLDPMARVGLRARKLARQLGYQYSFLFDPIVDVVQRPNGMHRQRFARESAALAAVCESYRELWTAVLERAPAHPRVRTPRRT